MANTNNNLHGVRFYIYIYIYISLIMFFLEFFFKKPQSYCHTHTYFNSLKLCLHLICLVFQNTLIYIEEMLEQHFAVLGYFLFFLFYFCFAIILGFGYVRRCVIIK
jgi:hypothetical protein